ncbi:MAG: outer membrane protein assembly factor BamD [Bacteroidota bacterium]
MYLFRKIIFLIIVAAIFCSACSDYNKLLKSTDYNKKYEVAVKYYDNGDYIKALALLEELVSVYRGTEKGEKILYYYAYATYASGNYILAGYYFNNFVKVFPNSSRTEECAYMYAYCFYMESPRYSLDQTDTKNAIKELQYFINKYPNNTRMKECNELIDKLRVKLEKKYYEISKQYFFLYDYKAAVSSFENLLKDFPDTQYREEVMFLILKANYIYALKSIETKKEERHKSTIDAYYKFLSYYSDNSKYMKDAGSIFISTKKQIEQLHKNKS